MGTFLAVVRSFIRSVGVVYYVLSRWQMSSFAQLIELLGPQVCYSFHSTILDDFSLNRNDSVGNASKTSFTQCIGNDIG